MTPSSLAGVDVLPPVEIMILSEVKEGPKKGNGWLHLSQDANYDKTIDKPPCIWHNNVRRKSYISKKFNGKRKQRYP